MGTTTFKTYVAIVPKAENTLIPSSPSPRHISNRNPFTGMSIAIPLIRLETTQMSVNSRMSKYIPTMEYGNENGNVMKECHKHNIEPENRHQKGQIV